MTPFKLRFLCAEEIEYEGECVYVSIPVDDGTAGIMAHHSNMITVMSGGELKIDTGKEVLNYAVTEGLVMVKNGEMTILAFSAEKPDEIDEKRAEEAAVRARIKLKRQHSELEYRLAQADLSRALNRLKVKQHR